MKVDELRELAKEQGIKGTSAMRKDDFVKALAGKGGDGHSGKGREGNQSARGRDGHESGQPGGRSKNTRDDGDGGVRTGSQSSSSIKYSQEIRSTEDEPERPGRSLATTSHDVIRAWAEERGATPATVPGTDHEGHLGVLRFDFGDDTEGLEHVGWDEWFETFDARRLNFLYQEERTDGRQSNFFQLENPDREDA